MDIKYEFPGSMEIMLSDDDRNRLVTEGYTTDRNGFRGIETKTHIKTGIHSEPIVTIDGDGDLNIELPFYGSPPTVVEAKDVRPGVGAYPDIVTHFLTASGCIIIDLEARKRLEEADDTQLLTHGVEPSL